METMEMEEFKKQLQELLVNSSELISTPAFYEKQKKKDGRVHISTRKLFQVTVKNRYPLPRI